MAGNTKDGHRKGAIKERSQTFNPVTEQWIKRDTTTGRFMSVSNNKFKGVKNEKKTVAKDSN